MNQHRLTNPIRMKGRMKGKSMIVKDRVVNAMSATNMKVSVYKVVSHRAANAISGINNNSIMLDGLIVMERYDGF